MRDQVATGRAARGRIIRKGAGIPPSSRPVPIPHSTQSTTPRVSIFARPQRVERIRRRVVTFLSIPLVFAASAGFMWSRPLEGPRVAGVAIGGANHDRFHTIGQEMAGRFSSKIDGVVVKLDRTSKVSQGTASSVKTAPRASEATIAHTVGTSQPNLHALEKQVYRVLKRHGKPVQNGKELAAAIVREALAQDYDPVFVAAVIKSESAFNSLARSHKGAQGLMQIMPKTGAWLADQQAIPRRKLTDPGHNLKLGISYLKQLEREYGGNRVLTLVAYNWGPGHVASASAGGRRVPGEVMQYAVKILNDYRRWSSELRSSVG